MGKPSCVVDATAGRFNARFADVLAAELELATELFDESAIELATELGAALLTELFDEETTATLELDATATLFTWKSNRE